MKIVVAVLLCLYFGSACSTGAHYPSIIALECNLPPYSVTTQVVGEHATSAQFGEPIIKIILLDTNSRTYSVFESGAWVSVDANMRTLSSTEIILSQVKQLSRNSSDVSLTKIDLQTTMYIESYRDITPDRIQSLERSGPCKETAFDKTDHR